ncbi:MAG: hypothetical protein NVSMB65_09210 [Chloroflexota bacterium]
MVTAVPGERVHTQPVVLDIGEDVGALIVYAPEALCNHEVEVSPHGIDWLRTHTEVLERRVAGRALFAAVFPQLPAGVYTLWKTSDHGDPVAVGGGAVVEVDWRSVAGVTLRRAAPEWRPAGDALFPPLTPDDLPPRYRQGGAVCSTPMGSAPLRYDADGQVAWDQMWAGFCDLALAGGPPHRDTVLQAPDPLDVLAAPEDYARVVSEIERGLRLVTGLPPVRGTTPGWVGLRCVDEGMARWLLRAITVENVAARREGAVLYVPAGPAFSRDREIKNVITVVAKTAHYWLEHRNG